MKTASERGVVFVFWSSESHKATEVGLSSGQLAVLTAGCQIVDLC